MAMGTSGVWFDKGYLIGGDTITFSLKTIANLWHDDVDSVKIKPTFKWIEPNGTVHDDVQIYYWDDKKYGQLIRYGTNRDLIEMTENDDEGSSSITNKFRFDNPNLAGSAWDFIAPMTTTARDDYDGDYHDDDFLFTIDYHNKLAVLNGGEEWSIGRFLGEENLSFCLSAIELNSKQRILTGNYEELKRNMNNNRDSLETFVLDADTS